MLVVLPLYNPKQYVLKLKTTTKNKPFRNRCYIYGANGKLGLHIPCTLHSKKRQKTKDIRTDNSSNWKSIHWKSIESAYRTSPYFEFYEDDFQSLFKNKSEWLMDYNFKCIDLIQQCLDVDLSYKTSTTFEKKLRMILDH